MRKFFYIVILVSLSFLASCQEAGQSSLSEIDILPAANLRVALNYGQNPPNYLKIINRIEQFQAKYPQIKIETIKIPDTIRGFNNWISNSQSLPDIIELNPNQVRMSLKDNLESLSPYMNIEIERLSLYNEAEQTSLWSGNYAKLIDAARIDGEMYIVTVRSDSRIIYYNKTLFSELGIPDPAEGWTWGQFVNAAQTLNSKKYAVSTFLDLQACEPFIVGLGGSYTSADQAHLIGYLDSEATINAFEQLNEPFFYDEAARDIEQPYGIIFDQPGRVSITYSVLTSTDDFSIAPFPTFNNFPTQNIAEISGLAISQSSEHKAAAWELIKFIIGDTDEVALNFVATNTIEYGDVKFHTHPHPRQGELINHLVKEMSSVFPSTFYMTTGIGDYGPGQSFSPNKWNSEDFDNVIKGKYVKSSLERMAKEMEGKMKNVYVKP